jgi:hypothetical protein
MRNKRILMPGIIERLDEWLLLNKPETWSARAHLVAYYGGAFILVLASLVYIIPDDPRIASGSGYWAAFTSIITLIALIAWLIYLLRFNVFKRYGISTGADRLKTFILYFIASGIIMLIPYVQPGVESVKANQAYPDRRFVKDIDDINIMINQLEYNNLDHEWGRDTFTVRDKLPGAKDNAAETIEEYDNSRPVTIQKKGLIDTSQLKLKLADADSVQQLNDSMYVILECPDYIFLSDYDIDRYADVKPMNKIDIYRQVVRKYVPPDRSAVNARLRLLAEKYDEPFPGYVYYQDDTRGAIEKRYNVQSMDSSVSNISNRKYRWEGSNLGILFRLFFYTTLIITLLVFVFRHSTAKTFFLSLLAIAVISILTGLLAAVSVSTTSGILILMLVWFGVFTLCTAIVWNSNTRSLWLGIGVNLFVGTVTFVPLVILALYDQLKEESHHYDPLPAFWVYVAEVSGLVLLLVLLPTYIHRLYRRWYALPED